MFKIMVVVSTKQAMTSQVIEVASKLEAESLIGALREQGNSVEDHHFVFAVRLYA